MIYDLVEAPGEVDVQEIDQPFSPRRVHALHSPDHLPRPDVALKGYCKIVSKKKFGVLI